MAAVVVVVVFVEVTVVTSVVVGTANCRCLKVLILKNITALMKPI